ncbi:terminase large subunit [Clostridium tertium]|uniref:terminase large subunit n=1 Tax=Clostridium tertium TaxID=1559 RepID=UPI0024B3361F|nr:terminase TerL endonuclease subunit [Clostridium tertium]MDI9216007.1 terminase large subunit [Clostridium tertium]
MAIKEELIDYCNKCLNDIYVSEFEDYISCEKHKQACKRLLNDFKKEGTEEFPYIWIEEEAQKIITWFTYLRHTKGVLARTPIYLTVWQKFFLCQIYGWKHKDTLRRRFTKSFIECARKQAKSQMQAGVGLYEMSSTATKNNELTENYTAGVKRDQSKIIFDEMSLMLNGSPLKSKFKITRDRITHIKTGSFTKPLSKEDRKSGDGTNINLLVLDEYHQHETSEYYDLFQGANSQEPLLMIITTAGVNINSPCFTQEYQYCSKLLDGVRKNDSYFVDILEIDKGDDIEKRRNWWKANPIRMSYPDGVKKLEDAYAVAKDIPEKMTSFLQKCLDQWQTDGGKNAYVDIADYNECVVNKPPIDLSNREVYIGIDGSSKYDLFGVTFHVPFIREKDKKLCIYQETFGFVPDFEYIQYHESNDKMPFTYWYKQGWIKHTDSEVIDIEPIMKFCFDKIKENNWKARWMVDDSNARDVYLYLLDRKQEIYPIFQSKKHVSDPTKTFRAKIKDGTMYFLENDSFKWQLSNAYVIQDPQDEDIIKIDKRKQKNRIDCVDSSIFATKLSAYWKPVVSLRDKIMSGAYK